MNSTKAQKNVEAAQAELERRQAAVEAQKAALDAADPDRDDWLAADQAHRRALAARDKAARELTRAKESLSAARRGEAERELAEVLRRLDPKSVEPTLAKMRARAEAAVRELYDLTVGIAALTDAQHADVARAEQLSAELGIACTARPVHHQRDYCEPIREHLKVAHATFERPASIRNLATINGLCPTIDWLPPLTPSKPEPETGAGRSLGTRLTTAVREMIG